jgi:ankyrin repeat domain-containing protein 50
MVVDDLHHVLESHQNDEALAYFYCDRNQTDRRNPVSILRSFVRQLSTTRNGDAIQPSLIQFYTQKRQKGFASENLNIEETESLLHQFIGIYPQTTLVLDALDECDPQTRARFIEVLDNLLQQSSKPIKIFISSRPDSDIKHRFESGPNVGIRATDNQEDIAKFLATKIEKQERWRNKISVGLREEVVQTLRDKSQGM